MKQPSEPEDDQTPSAAITQLRRSKFFHHLPVLFVLLVVGKKPVENEGITTSEDPKHA